MKPLIVLLTTSLLTLLITGLFSGAPDILLAMRVGMSAMLLFTSIGHFAFTRGMTLMLPGFMPFRVALIYLTGILEIVAAMALFIPAYRLMTGWYLILFFILMLPANIYAAITHVNYEKGDFTGPGPVYLWFRVPLQVLFIVWVYLAAMCPW